MFFKTRPGVPHILQKISKFAKYVSGVHIFSDQVHILQIFGSRRHNFTQGGTSMSM